MSLELQRVRVGRPTHLTDARGCTIFISTHDHYFLTTQAAYKRKLRSLHPDRYKQGQVWAGVPYKGGYFRECMVAYCAWLEKELQWYQNLGLQLPTKDL